jgi:AcrR family transcriptional regulator
VSPRAALTRDAIVAEAVALVRELGIEALSMRALAARMGVTAPAFYAHFSGRDDLLRACAQIGYDELATRFRATETDSPLGLVWASSRSYVHYALDEPELFSIMFLYRPGAIDIGVDNEHGGASTVFDRMIDNLAAGTAAGELAGGDPLERGLALWAAVHGVATVARLAPELDADRLLDDVLTPMLTGWRPVP